MISRQIRLDSLHKWPPLEDKAIRGRQRDDGKDLFSRFRAWFPDRSEERRSFFANGLVILERTFC